MTNKKQKYTVRKNISSPSGYGGISPNASDIPGDSIDKHRKIETANIILTGDVIRQQNENL